AQDLGAETATLPAQSAVEAVLDYARRHNLGRIVVGRSTRTRLRWWGRQSFNRRLGEQAPDIDLIAVAREEGRARRTVAAGIEPSEGARLRRGCGAICMRPSPASVLRSWRRLCYATSISPTS
ncbi:MAG: hypothetical protein ACREXU_12975, partial [Gammaproteobacteria bacterium]